MVFYLKFNSFNNFMSKFDKLIDENIQIDLLSDKEIFSFLKRYYTDSYEFNFKKYGCPERGIFSETIETLEKLHERLVVVNDFIGVDEIDWKDACINNNEAKKKDILHFYNGLIIDIGLMKIAVYAYSLSSQIEKYIRFLDQNVDCLFRKNVQLEPWSIHTFPDEKIFKLVREIRFFIKDNHLNSRAYDSNDVKGKALEIYKAIKPVKSIVNVLIEVRFKIIPQDKRKVNSVIQELGNSLSYQYYCENLPWICRFIKAEFELNREIRLLVGFIFDNLTLKNTDFVELIRSEVNAIYDHNDFEDNLITFDVIDIGQILKQLNADLSGEIKLTNNKKVLMILKWYTGIFYGMSRVIKPYQYTIESNFFELSPVFECNHRNFINKVHENSKKESDFVWSEETLIKGAPQYVKSLNEFYTCLGRNKEIMPRDVEKLKNFNLFFSYLYDSSLDDLNLTLTINNDIKSWPIVVRMYMSLQKQFFQHSNLKNCYICSENLIKNRILKSLNDVVKDLYSSVLVKNFQIESELKDIKVDLINCERFQNILRVQRLVEKNRRSALNYLNNSFKKNVLVLRFKLASTKNDINIKDVKDTFTLFLKNIKRAPKKIGADLDAYIGYLRREEDMVIIDFTTFFYVRENVSNSDVKLNIESYWKYFKLLNKEKTICNHSFDITLQLTSEPIIFVDGHQNNSLTVIKGDKDFSNLLKNLIVNFYTAFEYFNYSKSLVNGRATEFFLKGRVVRSNLKKIKEVNMLDDIAEESE